MKLGHYVENGLSYFRVFAPQKSRLELVVRAQGNEHCIPMQKDETGYWQCSTTVCPAGTEYKYKIDGHNMYADPASKRLIGGVHGWSVITAEPHKNPSNWRGIPIQNAVIYELHIGTFTKSGNLRGITLQIPYLRDLGITVIELMPIVPCPGKYNWGYDGNFLFALNENYGTYEDLEDLIFTAHQNGIAVILDVVYNHFGPEGNYASAFAPYLKRSDTPWGEAVNFDERYNNGIRDFFMENTRYWIEDIGFDGFRMDAVSLIFDNSHNHILRCITDLAQTIAKKQNRNVIMIAEHLRNNNLVTSQNGFNFDSQWVDDLNYALFAYLTGEKRSHYKDFGSFDDIIKALTQGFVLDGTRYSKSQQYFFGSSGKDVEPHKIIVHIQDHDQVGNRPFGDRMIHTYGKRKALLAATAVFASPYIPMIWQGEEYGETNPFTFFTDFGDSHLIHGVREGRKNAYEYAESDKHNIIDPNSEHAFNISKLDWEKLTAKNNEHNLILAYYKTLIRLKKDGIIGKAPVFVSAEQTFITAKTQKSLVLLNFGNTDFSATVESGYNLVASQTEPLQLIEGKITVPPFCSCILQKI